MNTRMGGWRQTEKENSGGDECFCRVISQQAGTKSCLLVLMCKMYWSNCCCNMQKETLKSILNVCIFINPARQILESSCSYLVGNNHTCPCSWVLSCTLCSLHHDQYTNLCHSPLATMSWRRLTSPSRVNRKMNRMAVWDGVINSSH